MYMLNSLVHKKLCFLQTLLYICWFFSVGIVNFVECSSNHGNQEVQPNPEIEDKSVSAILSNSSSEEADTDFQSGHVSMEKINVGDAKKGNQGDEGSEILNDVELGDEEKNNFAEDGDKLEYKVINELDSLTNHLNLGAKQQVGTETLGTLNTQKTPEDNNHETDLKKEPKLEDVFEMFEDEKKEIAAEVKKIKDKQDQIEKLVANISSQFSIKNKAIEDEVFKVTQAISNAVEQRNKIEKKLKLELGEGQKKEIAEEVKNIQNQQDQIEKSVDSICSQLETQQETIEETLKNVTQAISEVEEELNLDVCEMFEGEKKEIAAEVKKIKDKQDQIEKSVASISSQFSIKNKAIEDEVFKVTQAISNAVKQRFELEEKLKLKLDEVKKNEIAEEVKNIQIQQDQIEKSVDSICSQLETQQETIEETLKNVTQAISEVEEKFTKDVNKVIEVKKKKLHKK